MDERSKRREGGGGGVYKTGVTKKEQVKFYPYKSGGGGRGDRKRFSHAEGGECTKGFGVVLTQELEVLAILNAAEGGTKRFHSLGGALERINLSCGGRAKGLGPTIFPFCSPLST